MCTEDAPVFDRPAALRCFYAIPVLIYLLTYLPQTQETVTEENRVVKARAMIADSYKCLIFLSAFNSIMQHSFVVYRNLIEPL